MLIDSPALMAAPNTCLFSILWICWYKEIQNSLW